MKEDLEALFRAGWERAAGAPPLSQERLDAIASIFRGVPKAPQRTPHKKGER